MQGVYINENIGCHLIRDKKNCLNKKHLTDSADKNIKNQVGYKIFQNLKIVIILPN